MTLSDGSIINLSGSRTLVLRKGINWKDQYLEKLLMPLLREERPACAEHIESSFNTRVWKSHAVTAHLVIKMFLPRGIRDRLFLRKSRARRAAESGLFLLQKGFLSPEIIAQADLLRCFIINKSVMITSEIEGCFNMYSYAANFFSPDNPVFSIRGKRNFIEALGHLIGRLHKSGIFHGDLRPGNILITAGDEDPLFYFIDNERNRYFPKGLPAGYRLKNLVQINMIISPDITFSDRLRFINAYLSNNAELIPFKKQLVRKVFLKTKKRLSREMPALWE